MAALSRNNMEKQQQQQQQQQQPAGTLQRATAGEVAGIDRVLLHGGAAGWTANGIVTSRDRTRKDARRVHWTSRPFGVVPKVWYRLKLIEKD